MFPNGCKRLSVIVVNLSYLKRELAKKERS